MNSHGWWAVVAMSVAACVGACSKDGDDGPHWAKRADQIDRAAWVAACGPAEAPFTTESTELDGKGPGWTSESFKTEPAAGSTSRLYVRCAFYRHVHNQRLRNISIEVMAPANEFTPELRDSLRRLAEDVVPEALHATIREGAASPTMLSRQVQGFWIQAGFYGNLTDTRQWRMEVHGDL